jgi:hypothetical protein
MVRRVMAVFLAAGLALSGCGFLSSGQRGSTKPDGFTLRGYVSVGSGPDASAVPGPASAASTHPPCTAPRAADDVQAGGAVRVADPDGHTLAAGSLQPGIEDAGRCNFGFQITAVPGGVDRYVIGVGNRATATFPARDLRSDKPAVIVVNV